MKDAMNAVVLVVAGEGLLLDHEVALRAAILWIGKEGGELMASRNMQALDGDHSSNGCTPRCIAVQPHVERALLDLLIVLETWSDVDRQLLLAGRQVKVFKSMLGVGSGCGGIWLQVSLIRGVRLPGLG